MPPSQNTPTFASLDDLARSANLIGTNQQFGTPGLPQSFNGLNLTSLSGRINTSGPRTAQDAPDSTLDDLPGRILDLINSGRQLSQQLTNAGRRSEAVQLQEELDRLTRAGSSIGVNAFARSRAFANIKEAARAGTGLREANELAQRIDREAGLLGQLAGVEGARFGQALQTAQFKVNEDERLAAAQDKAGSFAFGFGQPSFAQSSAASAASSAQRDPIQEMRDAVAAQKASAIKPASATSSAGQQVFFGRQPVGQPFVSRQTSFTPSMGPVQAVNSTANGIFTVGSGTSAARTPFQTTNPAAQSSSSFNPFAGAATTQPQFGALRSGSNPLQPTGVNTLPGTLPAGSRFVGDLSGLTKGAATQARPSAASSIFGLAGGV